jgi:hypothetical protein
MKVLSTILSIAISGALSFAPAIAAENSAQLADASGIPISNEASCAHKKIHRRAKPSPKAETETTKTVTTETTTSPPPQPQTITQPAVVEQPCAPTVCAPAIVPQVLTQPALYQELPPRHHWGWLAALLVAGGVATAIAVPIAVSHHHHHNQVASIQQQQLLLFGPNPPFVPPVESAP